MKNATFSKVTIRIQEKKKPISDETIGFRFQAAIPNQAAVKMKPVKKKGEHVGFMATNIPTTSFRKDYLIFETGDMSEINERDFERFLGTLKGLGFSHYQWAAEGAKECEI